MFSTEKHTALSFSREYHSPATPKMYHCFRTRDSKVVKMMLFSAFSPKNIVNFRIRSVIN